MKCTMITCDLVRVKKIRNTLGLEFRTPGVEFDVSGMAGWT